MGGGVIIFCKADVRGPVAVYITCHLTFVMFMKYISSGILHLTRPPLPASRFAVPRPRDSGM